MLQSQKAKKKKIDAKCENEGEKQWDSILKLKLLQNEGLHSSTVLCLRLVSRI